MPFRLGTGGRFADSEGDALTLTTVPELVLGLSADFVAATLGWERVVVGALGFSLETFGALLAALAVFLGAGVVVAVFGAASGFFFTAGTSGFAGEALAFGEAAGLFSVFLAAADGAGFGLAFGAGAEAFLAAGVGEVLRVAFVGDDLVSWAERGAVAKDAASPNPSPYLKKP